MGCQDIKSFFAPKLPKEFKNPSPHLPVRILVGTVFVTHGTAKPQDADAFIFVNLSVYADTPFRGCVFVTAVVVAVDIQHGSLKKVARKDR